MGRWGDGEMGRWEDGEIYIFAQLNVFHINILPRQRISPATVEGKTGEMGIIEEVGERIIKGLFCPTLA
ncbi:hypothetical protein [Okeania sp. SIO1I7]|uniref:hypothetical protein n=1 Tax=Okeania sp. SIO1I7 TaxID=2607772 RepID=UPI0025D9604B|nr:hypothetical protein [Okeania sp. SIO1I7]